MSQCTSLGLYTAGGAVAVPRLRAAATNYSLPCNLAIRGPARGLGARARGVAQSASFVPRAAAAPASAPVGPEYDAAHLKTLEEYKAMYARSVEDPAAFWGDVAREFHWEQAFKEDHLSYNFDVRSGPIFTKFFEGGKTNIAYNCLDRHVAEGRGDTAAFIWEGNEPGLSFTMSYREVLDEVCRVANYLRSLGVKKGDAVAIYMPMVCELPIAMLACARIGAMHSVVFGGFSSRSLADRIVDCKAKVLLTASGVLRGAKPIGLKAIADEAMDFAADAGNPVETCVLLEKPEAAPKADTSFVEGRDVWWADAVEGQSTEAEVEWMDSEDPLFLLYTSGSTGSPKGVLHSTGGYMVGAAATCKYVFDMKPGDVYWCTADCGWITGHTYLTYGPLLNGVTSLVFEGVPTYPDPARCWAICEQHKVNVFYTAPTAIRSLMRGGDDWVEQHDLGSLRILGTVGEPINPEAWRWYHEVVGGGRCPIVDTWWQTETGTHMITPLPGSIPERPGSATLPFFGVQPAIVDENGVELEGACEGYLCIKTPWPSTIRTVYGDPDRYETTYFAPFKGFYFSGDGARRDPDGYIWITGRVDDVINVSGHRIGTAEVESALVAQPACAEAAVVGFEHPIKGQGIYAFCTLMEGQEGNDDIRKSLVAAVRKEIGPFAAPDVIHWAPTGLPKTRSGKIMRRVLRKIATKEEASLGDTSTLADPGVVDDLIKLRGQ